MITAMVETEQDSMTDHVQAALSELAVLGIVKSVDDTRRTVTLDLPRLYSIGYSIMFESTRPVFVRNEHIMYLCNSSVYFDDTVPTESLYSYCMIKIKCNGLSP